MADDRSVQDNPYDTRVRVKFADEKRRAAEADAFVKEESEKRSLSERDRQQLLREAFNDGVDVVRARMSGENGGTDGHSRRSRRAAGGEGGAA